LLGNLAGAIILDIPLVRIIQLLLQLFAYSVLCDVISDRRICFCDSFDFRDTKKGLRHVMRYLNAYSYDVVL